MIKPVGNNTSSVPQIEHPIISASHVSPQIRWARVTLSLGSTAQNQAKTIAVILGDSRSTLWYIIKHGKSWKIMENHGKSWKIMEDHGKSWKIMENHGKSWKIPYEWSFRLLGKSLIFLWSMASSTPCLITEG